MTSKETSFKAPSGQKLIKTDEFNLNYLCLSLLMPCTAVSVDGALVFSQSAGRANVVASCVWCGFHLMLQNRRFLIASAGCVAVRLTKDV